MSARRIPQALTAEPLAHKPRVALEPNTYESGACWTLLARRGGRLWHHSYGTLRLASGRIVRAHRWAYAAANGPIPEGLCVHHRCFNPLCINPGHLELITCGENSRLSNFPARRTEAA